MIVYNLFTSMDGILTLPSRSAAYSGTPDLWTPYCRAPEICFEFCMARMVGGDGLLTQWHFRNSASVIKLQLERGAAAEDGRHGRVLLLCKACIVAV